MNFFISIDFDGTIVGQDITDEVIKRFAGPGWEPIEEEWERGLIGSRECLSRQMSLIEAPLEEALEYIDRFEVDKTFPGFISFLRENNIPHAVVSDGFKPFSQRILKNAGLSGLPVYANALKEEGGRLKAYFPYSKEACPSGTCKCAVAGDAGGGAPVILIGDGRSDFGLAGKAAYVFAKRKLVDHCSEKKIPHSAFRDFSEIEKNLRLLEELLPKGASGRVFSTAG